MGAIPSQSYDSSLHFLLRADLKFHSIRGTPEGYYQSFRLLWKLKLIAPNVASSPQLPEYSKQLRLLDG